MGQGGIGHRAPKKRPLSSFTDEELDASCAGMIAEIEANHEKYDQWAREVLTEEGLLTDGLWTSNTFPPPRGVKVAPGYNPPPRPPEWDE